MKRKVLWMLLSFVIALALMLSSCGPAEVGEEEEEVKKEVGEEEEEEEEEVVVVPGEPQYGGTLTVLTRRGVVDADPGSPDIADGLWSPTYWLTPIQEKPIMGDFEKYGPRGTGEYDFQLIAFQPDKFLKGLLLESWEISPDKTVWHVRPGVMWQSREGVMEARELTAEDVVADLLYFREAPGGKGFKGMTTGEIYTTDRYTLVIETPYFDVSLMYYVGYEDRAIISPPEMVDAGADRWENQVGTGPFMLKEYVVGSHMKYERNPNYWDTTTINGVEYELPFLDYMIFPIIPDEATQMAALRTGVADMQFRVPARFWPLLEETAPGLLSSKAPAGRGMGIALKNTEPPFDDVKVRRAMMIGTDLKAFADIHNVGPLPLHWFPSYTGNPDVFTPLEELPADIRILYEYNPTLAKQMLAEAGYPDGFEMYYYTDSLPMYLDIASLVVSQWAKIGVEVKVKAVDRITDEQLRHEKTYTDAIYDASQEVGNPNELVRIGQTDHFFNIPLWSNERFDELMAQWVTEPDAAKRNPLAKEAAVIMVKEAPYIPLTVIPMGHFWWPWMKNYYGERNVLDQDIVPVIARTWIDQDLKAEMGY